MDGITDEKLVQVLREVRSSNPSAGGKEDGGWRMEDGKRKEERGKRDEWRVNQSFPNE